jgi:hypothetical protein
MKALRKICLPLLMLDFLCWLYPSLRARSQGATNSKETLRTPRFGLDITVPNGGDFYVPVIGKGQTIGAVPLAEGRFSGVRIVPRQQGSSVKIDVSALVTGKSSLSKVTCRELQNWHSEQAGSYTGNAGESLVLLGLKKFGLPPLKIKIIPARPAPAGAPNAEFCGCGRTISFPNPGMCIGLGGCGECCAASPQ